MSEIKCPKCGSTQITANKKGFSGKKAIAGAVLTGGIGLLAGTIGSNNIVITCLSCNNTFQPGEGAEKLLLEEGSEFEQQIITTIRTKGLLAATVQVKEKTGVDLSVAKECVDSIVSKHGLRSQLPVGKGCAGVIIFAMSVVGASMYFLL